MKRVRLINRLLTSFEGNLPAYIQRNVLVMLERNKDLSRFCVYSNSFNWHCWCELFGCNQIISLTVTLYVLWWRQWKFPETCAWRHWKVFSDLAFQTRPWLRVQGTNWKGKRWKAWWWDRCLQFSPLFTISIWKGGESSGRSRGWGWEQEKQRVAEICRKEDCGCQNSGKRALPNIWPWDMSEV